MIGKNNKIRAFTFFILIIIMPGVYSQGSINGEDIEVGIVEKLGATIPADLWFFNENNDTVYLREIINKPTILSLVYFDCPGICSPLMTGISDVVRKMDMKLGEEYQLLTISFNTTDTPEKARVKKQNFIQNISKENRENWIYLTGEQDNITRITHAVGFKYKPQGLDFLHPGAIIMISPHGKITRYLYGINFLPFDVKMALIEAQKGLARPTISKILEYCFAYDPAGKTYTLQITRILGSLVLLVALTILTVLVVKGRRKTINT